MRTRWLALLSVLIAVLCLPGQARAQRLNIYFVDTEGGAATLIITPQKESVLIDCGNPGSRDAERIYQAATRFAGVKAIDHLIITHWHSDHFGGVSALSRLMPIRHFYDRGLPPDLPDDPNNFPILSVAYQHASHGHSTVLQPGDEIPLKQGHGAPPLHLKCLCARQQVVPDAPEAPVNPIASQNQPQPIDTSDNANSLGFLLSFGSFRFLDLGDLTWNIEYKLVSPTDKIGPIDVYQTTHHGLGVSNNPVLVKTVRPRVAIFNNGPRKGADASVMTTLRSVPDIQAIYQLHRNLLVSPDMNTDPALIANRDDPCQGEFIKLSVAPNSKSYTVTVGSHGKARRYQTRLAER